MYIFFTTDWRASKGLPASFEGEAADDLATHLRQFYAEVRNKKGEKYGWSALVNLRASIQRHLTSPLYNRIIDLSKDREFTTANNMLKAQLKVNRVEGRDESVHKKAIPEGDMDHIFNRMTLSNPSDLQMRIFMDIMVHFGRRGREGLRELRRDSFQNKVDGNGKRFAILRYHELDKTMNGIDPNVGEHSKKMYEEPSSGDHCPIKTLEFYLSKLNPSCTAFFQRCNPRWGKSGRWYDNMAMGKGSLGMMMSKISAEAKLSDRYTNHCLRATTVTALSHAGFESKDICSVIGHKSEVSLKHYCQEPSDKQKAKISSRLHSYMKENDSSLACVSRPDDDPMPSAAPFVPQNNYAIMSARPQPGPSSVPDVPIPKMSPLNDSAVRKENVSNVVTVSNYLTKYTAVGVVFAGAVFNGPTTFNFH